MSIQSQEDYIRFEGLCQDSFQKPDEAIRIEEILQNYFLNPNFLIDYKKLLQYSKNSYVIAQVARGLLRCITQYWNSIPSPQRQEIKSNVWLYIESLPTIETFALISIIKLYSRILKFTWNEDNVRNQFMESLQAMLKLSPDHHSIGLKMLKDIIVEFSDQSGDHLQSAQHRNLSISLRDHVLMKFYSTSLDSLKTILGIANIKLDKVHEKIRDNALELSFACLSVDFIKTSSYDTSEEILTVQIPLPWKPLFDDPNTTQLYFKIYRQWHCTKALECLTQVASIRRSLFMTEDERTKFLTNIFRGILEILQTNTGLNNDNNHLAFCRVLERIKTNYHFNQLVVIEGYQEWISLLSQFTTQTLNNPNFSPNSVYCLLSLWAKFVASLIYVKGDPNKTCLDKYTPAIMETFIKSKVEASVEEEEDENLVDYEKMIGLLEHIPFLGRLAYKTTCSQILQIFDTILQRFSYENNINNLMILERQSAWLIYIIGSLVTGRTGVNASEEYDFLDGDLAARVFKMVDLCDKRVQHDPGYKTRQSRIALELSIIYFMQNYRKVYIGDNSLSTSKIYSRLSELLGQTDHNTILISIMRKIGFNFKYWGEVEDVIKRSLDIFWDSVNGLNTAKIIVNTPITSEILKNHGPEMFPFMENNSNSRHRTTLYKAIGKLLFSDDNIQYFDEFVAPFDDTFAKLSSIATIEGFRTAEVQKRITGIFRDLRGIACSALTKKHFAVFYDWVSPKLTDLVLKIFKSLADCPEVTGPVLKFYSEFLFNRQSRLNFEASSPAGYILFRETSKILTCYDLIEMIQYDDSTLLQEDKENILKTFGSLILTLNCSKENLYKYKLKGINTVMLIFVRSLVGNFCNFGVFELFGDKSFSSLLDVIFQLLLSITLDELMSFPKVSKTYMILVETLANNHTQILIDMNTKYFVQIMYSILKSVDSQDTQFSNQACIALDKIISLCHQYSIRKKDVVLFNNCKQHFIEHPNLLPQIIDKLFYGIIYEDNLNQWSISKPLLGCVIFSPDIYLQSFNSIKLKYIQMNPNHQEKIEEIFTSLMHDILNNLESKNRDKFTQNIAIFRREMRQLGTHGPTTILTRSI
ncbi:exportin 7 [Cavenderia fasciculata]|uniref:Exportin 7 n=1 Tax=Cavenderia fasciculata TaxID=261658 RepID=F4PLY1_CACFS|nr:exportin 7 [Cavenderia fasciculata]EGG23535.1 exportin 7 [Cavenderia fasciculata]|eukprot:XP_004361386.1 exportin 7 [Cavenderia fasciculata]